MGVARQNLPFNILVTPPILYSAEIIIKELDCSLQLSYRALCFAGTPDVVPAAAHVGDVATLRNHLEKNPQHVRKIYTLPLSEGIYTRRTGAKGGQNQRHHASPRTTTPFLVQVNSKKAGKGALHLAIVDCFRSVVELMLQFNPDVDIQVSLYVR